VNNRAPSGPHAVKARHGRESPASPRNDDKLGSENNAVGVKAARSTLAGAPMAWREHNGLGSAADGLNSAALDPGNSRFPGDAAGLTCS
jgi:hypothetical protein